MENNKMTKDTLPTGFTAQMAGVDLIPCIFFSGIGIVLGLMLSSILFYIGAALTFISGFIKAIWKMIVAKKHKNIWPMFVQMRIVMPIGFLLMIIGFIVYACNNDLSVLSGFNNIYSWILLALGLIGMGLMFVFAFKLDSSSSKSNWIEQICNSFAQCFIFLACLIAYIL